MKLVTTAAGIIFNSKNQVLCALRDQGKYDYVSFKWEFPGGKLELGETNEQALSRELKEELNMNVEICEKFYQVEHDYPDFHLSMAVYICKYQGGEIKMNVHKDMKWMNIKDMINLDWAPADKPVCEAVIQKLIKKQ